MRKLPMDKPNEIRKGRHILIFSDGCEVCSEHIDNVEVGKCAGCLLHIISLDSNLRSVKDELEKYKITEHPTTIIDGEIKVEGVPTFYWQCGDDFYEELKKNYSFNH
ncbi:MAG: thioredoxin family protein [Candidatus Kariarchaeaceae archaeon]